MSSQGNDHHTISDAGRHAAKKRSLTSVRMRQQHIAHIAEKYANSPLSTLGHHMDMLWMRTAFERINKNSAPGVDKVTAAKYAEKLAANLADLLERAKSGRYRATPVKRVEIPKNKTEKRAIGIPTTERKVLEKAVQMLLEPLYETEFSDCSYGFRPKRNPHQALEALRDALKQANGGWVLDADIRSYFDSVPLSQLREILSYRVKDTVITRLIHKWLKAGVWKDEQITMDDKGVPQGGVLSPLLSNVYLDTVLDKWIEQIVKPRLRGKARLIRFADDFVIVFEYKDDAEKVMRVLPKRFAKYGLEIHQEKTRLVDFRHPWKQKAKPGTFDFLGFTHYWGKTRKGGYAVTKQTSSEKMRNSLKRFHKWCKRNRHQDLGWQHGQLCKKLMGHYAYYGVTGNYRKIAALRNHVICIWRYWLNRRSRKRDGMKWSRFKQLLKGKYRIPPPRIVHKWNRTQQVCLNF